MNLLTVLAAIAACSTTLAAALLAVFVRNLRGLSAEAPDPARVAALLRRSPDYNTALINELDAAALSADLDAWGNQ